MSAASLQKQFNSTPSQEEVDAFVAAAHAGDITQVKKFLNQYSGAVNEKAKYGNTALIEAAEYGYQTVLELLLDHGADVNKTSMGG